MSRINTQNLRPLDALYGNTSLALLTDLYQITMVYALWKRGLADKEGVFHGYFRKNPFNGGFAVASGLTHTVNYLQRNRFDTSDLDALSELLTGRGNRLFEDGFLKYLSGIKLSDGNFDAVPEGTFVFPHAPMSRYQGKLSHGMLLETPWLDMNGFASLIATKACRVKIAAGTDPVLDFGLRRAQGIDGALMASWAAFVGGADATSNVLAYKLFGIPAKGTFSHAWPMSFDTGRGKRVIDLRYDHEYQSYLEYAQALPENCVFLVDTYGTIEGIRKAIEVCKWLREQGFEAIGIRLDSGDLAYLSKQGRRMLDRAGFKNVLIFGTNDLDEKLIFELKQKGARIAVWGVGTKMITAYDQPAMGVVWKLAAWRMPGENWNYPIKLSEDTVKVSTPGIMQVRRFAKRGHYLFDMIVNTEDAPTGDCYMIDPHDHTRRKLITRRMEFEDLLVPITRAGSIVYNVPSLAEHQARTKAQVRAFDDGIKTIVGSPEYQYPVGLEEGLYRLKTDLILRARGFAS